MKKAKIYLAMTNIDKDAGNMQIFEKKMKFIFGDMVELYKHNSSDKTYNPKILENCDLMIIFASSLENAIHTHNQVYRISKGTKVLGKGIVAQINVIGLDKTIIYCEDTFYFSEFSVERFNPYSGNSAHYAKIILPKINYITNTAFCNQPITYEDVKEFYGIFNNWLKFRKINVDFLIPNLARPIPIPEFKLSSASRIYKQKESTINRRLLFLL